MNEAYRGYNVTSLEKGYIQLWMKDPWRPSLPNLPDIPYLKLAFAFVAGGSLALAGSSLYLSSKFQEQAALDNTRDEAKLQLVQSGIDDLGDQINGLNDELNQIFENNILIPVDCVSTPDLSVTISSLMDEGQEFGIRDAKFKVERGSFLEARTNLVGEEILRQRPRAYTFRSNDNKQRYTIAQIFSFERDKINVAITSECIK